MSLANACKRCFGRKQKCDRARPSCSHCLNARVPCVPRVTAHVTAEDMSSSEAASSPACTIDYMKRRIRYLEGQASYQQLPTPSESHENHGPVNGQTHDHLGEGSAVNDGTATTSNDKVMDHALNEIGYLSLATMGDHMSHETVFGDERSYINFVLAALGVRSSNPASTSSGPQSSKKKSSNRWFETMPDSDFSLTQGDATFCVRRFVEYSNLLHPCVSQERCFDAYETVRTAEREGNIAQVAFDSPELIIFAYTSVGMGMMLTDADMAVHAIVPRFMKKVRDAIPRLVEHGSNVALIESLLMIAMVALHTPAAGSAWYLIGLAMSKAVSLGMHRQTLRPVTSALVVGKEKLFWTLYKLDRTVALALDRPCCIEDADIIINLPEMPHPSVMTDSVTRIQALHLWAIYHSQMLSDWRNDPDADPEFYLSTFEYWRNTYQGITEKELEDRDDETSQESSSFYLNLVKYESQLCLRAINQLVAILAHKKVAESVDDRLRQLVLAEVPRFVTYMQESIEKFGTMCSWLNGYDAFTGGIIYIDALYRPLLEHCQPGQQRTQNHVANDPPPTYFTGSSKIKVLASCSEILAHVGERFESMQTMKDVIWAFLAAVEARLVAWTSQGEHETTGPPILDPGMNACQKLRALIEDADLKIPTSTRRIMSACLEMGKHDSASSWERSFGNCRS